VTATAHRKERYAALMKTITSILCTLLWSVFLAPLSGATVYNSNGSAANIQFIHDTRAVDGDTITLPAGIFSWTSRVNITKGITLRGATTISGAGSANPTINDGTIVKDDTPKTGPNLGIIRATMRSNQSFRLTGITFSAGVSTIFASGNGTIQLLSHDSAPCTSMRVDHCHFNLLYQGKIIWVRGWVYGVADHNVFDVRNGSFPFHIWQDTWGGASQTNGNGSWADYPWYGTGKFFFMEDNTARASSAEGAKSFVDTFYGGRWVARHNYLLKCIPNGHGTEGGAARGQRASEFYDNTVKMTVPWSGGGQRSGTSLWHDNLFIGIESQHGHTNLANYRETPARPNSVWGIADGTSVWDQNDTDGNGHYVEGQPPYVFASGTVTTASVIVESTATITDSTKHWTVNQWAGYSIKSTSSGSPSYTLGSYVISNTSNTITYYYYWAGDAKIHLTFNAGNTYQIHRVLTMMDQNGRGKGDQVTGGTQPINTVTGTPFWTHVALEPCFSWNNIHSVSNRVYGFTTNPAQPTTKLGLDYFNLGGGFPGDTTPSQVSSRYGAALNGVNYTGTYTYPHPLNR